ncbi:MULTISPECIES: hypothetical protein [Bosea]|jgi:hypothetical protein|uniref:Uncharacterized protein n=1 Tax=Bosea vaviloviae TaxID=1526658 RepID=A0A0N0MAR4_9HYPH|nr:hypothetical protein [Bosea vaviloviae]KPH79964.1 hypothetical protein AE618_15550 [Bosea vaviloviae]
MDPNRENATSPVEDDTGRIAEADGAAHQTSLRTNVHDEGSDANDTNDGLTESQEAVRHAAEDIPTGQRPEGRADTIPVFDRGSLPPKV